MIALCILALIAFAYAATTAGGATTASAGCTTDDSKKIGDCGTAVGTCTSGAAGNLNTICGCYGTYIKCIGGVTNAGCKTAIDSAKKTFGDACIAIKCTAAQCASAGSLVASLSMVAAFIAARFL